MIKKIIILGGFIAIGLVAACSRFNSEEPTPNTSFPTATSYFLFQGSSSTSTAPSNLALSPSAEPTIADVFQVYPSATPLIFATPTPAQDVAEIQIRPSQYFTVTVYQDGLNPNWEVQKDSGMNYDLNVSSTISRGQSSVSFTPVNDRGRLFFTVAEKSQETYPREQAVQLSFWLYSGEEPLALDQLFITIVGSNSQPYWSADDQSVTISDGQPVFPEIGLDELGFNHEIPAQTWVPVDLDLDEFQTFEPDYQYVTGFYLKTSAGLARTLMIDDISLVMVESTDSMAGPVVLPTPTPDQRKVVTVLINTRQAVHPISELIYGVSGANADYMQALRPTFNSWGGNSSTRYNWQIGHAWNAGRDYFYHNENHGITDGSASDEFISQTLNAGAEVRLTLPTLGWVARNDDMLTCSFPLPGGGCGDANGASCFDPGQIADPHLANVPSSPGQIASWIKYLVIDRSFKIRFFAMDNEPELWGYTHYDVHPNCTTYNEILTKYLTYSEIVHNLAPEAELVGPVTSSWNYYWNSAAGENDKFKNGNQDFLPWFLSKLQQNDQSKGWRSLHVLDIHYFPQNVYSIQGFYNELVDEKTAALRLRSTRSLWDKGYVDESSINEPVYLVPRLKALIEKFYPGTKLGLSGWNWGAEQTMNGALAIADVLGIFGREDLYYANYWQYPPLKSPGFYAFKIYTNYDDRGSRFGDTSVSAKSSDVDTLSSFAALDSAAGNLQIMLVNKQVAGETLTRIKLGNFTPETIAAMYRYDGTDPEGITESTITVSADEFSISLPAYSITLLIIKEAE